MYVRYGQNERWQQAWLRSVLRKAVLAMLMYLKRSWAIHFPVRCLWAGGLVLGVMLFILVGCTSNTGTDDILLPVAMLEAFPTTGQAPLDVAFDASGSWARDGSTLTYDWDMDGDGTFEVTGGTETVDHTFDTAGDHTVRVRVTDGENRTATANASVTVTEPAEVDPVADLGAYPDTGTAPLSVGLDASASWSRIGGELTYDYDIDSDGDYEYTDAGDNISHEYTAAGSYTATVRVTDTQNNTDTATVDITVQ